ncbi:MAG: hypothetical protein ACREQ3_14845, partial [Candidatus Binatia bacterium]
SNPSFDAAFLQKLLKDISLACPIEFQWHHRLWDLSAYAAGVLHLDYLPGLADVCDLLNVSPPDHSAESDVTSTGNCFLKLFEMIEVQLDHRDE